MTYNYVVSHIPISGSKRPGSKNAKTSITIHNTANPSSTAKNERDWLINPSNDRTASWHLCVDESTVYEAIPLTETAYHCGVASGNAGSIGIEVCESGDQNKVWDNAITLVASLLRHYGWSTGVVRTHKSWSGKNCPRLILPKWQSFIEEVNTKLSADKNKVSSWAEDAQQFVVDKKIADGERPQDYLTRQELWVVMQRFWNLVQ